MHACRLHEHTHAGTCLKVMYTHVQDDILKKCLLNSKKESVTVSKRLNESHTSAMSTAQGGRGGWVHSAWMLSAYSKANSPALGFKEPGQPPALMMRRGGREGRGGQEEKKGRRGR